MQDITSVDGLKNAIQLLEFEQQEKGKLLKEQFLITYNNLRTFNLVKKTLKDIFSPSGLVDNISGTALGAVTGFLLKKFFIGSSESKLKKLIASLLQFGITGIMSRFSDQIALYGKAILQTLFRKNESNSSKK